MLNEQISISIKRFNSLEQEQELLSYDIISRDQNLYALREEITSEINKMHVELKQISHSISLLDEKKREVTKLFKKLLKKQVFSHLESKVEKINFENLISRDELYRS